MTYKFSKIPLEVKHIETKHRKIITKIPPEETISVIKNLEQFEPQSMSVELPVLWDHAQGYQVFDASGNIWIDFSSGIFVANIGHSHKHVKETIQNYLDNNLLHNYYFPSHIRSLLVKKLIEITPQYLNTIFLLTTGSESTECALKLARIHGKKINPKKIGIISFIGSMHGKTLGALMMGGKSEDKHWISNLDSDIHHIQFPYDQTCQWGNQSNHKCNYECFDKSLESLKNAGVDLSTIAAFMIESYQGWGAMFFPKDYVQRLSSWAKENNVLVIFDEIQSGFGRTGKLFAFEHYDVQPDLVCCGKGISSSLPLSAVIGRREIMDVDPSLNSTHGGNPLCCAATLANLEVLEDENLVFESARKEKIITSELSKIQEKFPNNIIDICGRGMAFAIHIKNSKTKNFDIELTDKIIEKCMQKGVLMVRTGSGTIKIGPPLNIPDDALKEGLTVIHDAIKESI